MSRLIVEVYMNNNFNEILSDFLLDNGLTQTAFANRLGVKQSQVSEWLKGKAKPGYETLRALVLAFDKPAEFWLNLQE